jgi:hypothetical protein
MEPSFKKEITQPKTKLEDFEELCTEPFWSSHQIAKVAETRVSPENMKLHNTRFNHFIT